MIRPTKFCAKQDLHKSVLQDDIRPTADLSPNLVHNLAQSMNRVEPTAAKIGLHFTIITSFPSRFCETGTFLKCAVLFQTSIAAFYTFFYHLWPFPMPIGSTSSLITKLMASAMLPACISGILGIGAAYTACLVKSNLKMKLVRCDHYLLHPLIETLPPKNEGRVFF